MHSRMIFNISPPKSGTTAMYHCLARCQNVAKPKVKEPRFFARKLGPQIGNLPPRLNLDGRFHLGFQWFEGLYKSQSRYRLDFSTYYAATEMTPEIMHAYDEQAKLLLILRDPVERILSHYYHYAKTGVALPPIRHLMRPETALSRYLMRFADYAGIYERFAAQFGEEQICVLDFRDLSLNPHTVEAQIQNFLALPDFQFNPKGREINPSGRAKSLMLQRLLSGRHAQLLSQLAPFSHDRLLEMRRRVVAWNTRAQKNPTPDTALLQALQEQLAPQYRFLNDLFEGEGMCDAA